MVCGLPLAGAPLTSVPFSVINPTEVPGESEAVLTLMVNCPICPGATVPPEGVAASQGEARIWNVVLHLSVLPPLLVMVTTCPVGLGCPWVLLKFRLSGETAMMGALGGGGACTCNCTITDWVLCWVVKAITPV